jgi:triacylglycerol esterase/lipase EstA (alpha/beta hydrolase family)
VTPARARFEGQGVLARSLLVLALVEIGMYAVLGWWLVGVHGWALAAALALAAVIAVGWRVAVTLASYAVAWRYLSRTAPEFQRSAFALIPHILREAAVMIAVYGVLQPVERLVMGDARPPPNSSGRLPVLLVPGYVCNRALWWAFARALRARGQACWAVTLEPVYGRIDDLVRPLAAAIDEVLSETGRPQVVIVAHSMGGLVARAYLRDYGARKVARLITLGSPHHGSMHACLGAGLNAREMEPGSAWLAALAAAEGGGFPVPFTSIFSYHDNFVAPPASSGHPSAINVPLVAVGHLSLVFSPKVLGLVVAELDATKTVRC